jgi:hypothetical protein
MSSPKVEEVWWAKLPGAPMLTKVVITHATQRTVGIAQHTINKLQQPAPVRFSWDDVEFLELADE